MSDPTSISKSERLIQQNKVIDTPNTNDLIPQSQRARLTKQGIQAPHLTPVHIIQLQRHIGNTATRQLINRDASGETGSATKSSPLPASLKAEIESESGISLEEVRVHYNSALPAQMSALAYTQGVDIHVGPGQETHLPHEAWHVVQQKQGRVKPTKKL